MLWVEKLKAGSLPALTFEVADGQCLAIEGPSGVGKTRLLRAIADLEPADGRVFLDGVERGELPATEWRRRVRYCAAEPGWWSQTPREGMWSRAPQAQNDPARAFSGRSGSRFGEENARKQRARATFRFRRNETCTGETPDASTIAAAGTRIERLLATLGLPAQILDRPVSVLSTGERLRLGLVRALVDDPKVVLLDEPTASLDTANAALVDELVKFLLLAGRTVLLVSHDPRQIDRLAHARLQLQDKNSGPSVAQAEALP